MVVMAVLIQRQVGGNPRQFWSQSPRQSGNGVGFAVKRTLTAQGRISGLVISMLPFAIAAFIFMINPEYIMPLFVEPLGRIMLAMGLGGQVLAAILIRKIVNIRV